LARGIVNQYDKLKNMQAGILVINKPPGWTSHDVVAFYRTKLTAAHGGQRVKVGHAGTLDPFATGVLLLLIFHCL